jgi:histidine triad (HIT) family protein
MLKHNCIIFDLLTTKAYQVMSSIFTRIIKGEIPSYKIAENELFYAFLDIRPVRPGHTLVVPKIELDYVFDLPEQTLCLMLPYAQRIAKAIDTALGCLRTGIVVEGLEVPHAHLHLIPIYQVGEHAALGTHVELTTSEMSSIAERIRQQMTMV